MFRTMKRFLGGYRRLQKQHSPKNKQINYQMILNGAEIDARSYTITSFLEKIQNLNMQNDISGDVGYRFVNKRAISTFGFNGKVDVILCNWHHTIVDLYEEMPPQKMTHHYDDARFVYIFPKNFIKKYSLKIRDILGTKKMSQY